MRNQKVVRGHLHKNSAQPFCSLPIGANSILDEFIVSFYLFGAALIDNYDLHVIVCILRLFDGPFKILQRDFASILVEEDVVLEIGTLLVKSRDEIFDGMKGNVVGSIFPLPVFTRCDAVKCLS